MFQGTRKIGQKGVGYCYLANGGATDDVYEQPPEGSEGLAGSNSDWCVEALEVFAVKSGLISILLLLSKLLMFFVTECGFNAFR